MNRRKYRVLAIMLLGVLLGGAGCAGKESLVLDPKSPMVITMWHAYNAVAEAQSNDLVMEFNKTAGMEQGIVLDAVGYGSSEELEDALYASANHVIGSDPLPDILASYSDNAYRLDKIAPLVSLDQYLTKEERERYRPELLEEGVWDASGGFKMIPVSKSMELLYLNRTDWDRFAEETGASMDLLQTWEGLSEATSMYYERSSGCAFLGMNSCNDSMMLSAAQMGGQVYWIRDGKVESTYPGEIAAEVWDAFYVSRVKRWYEGSVYNQDGIKSGHLTAYIGSSVGAGFFPREVIENENQSHVIECESLLYPTFQDGTSHMTQRGASMAVFVSDTAHEYGSVQLLKWFTQPEQNIRFAVSTGYLPVEMETLASVNDLLGRADESDNAAVIRSSIQTALDAISAREFYIHRPFEGSYNMTQTFASSLEDKVPLDLHEKKRGMETGESREGVERDPLGEGNLKEWYEALIKEMAGRTDG